MTGIMTSENSLPRGKSSSDGWFGLAAFYHILLYIGDRFFVQLLDSFRDGRWSFQLFLDDISRSVDVCFFFLTAQRPCYRVSIVDEYFIPDRNV